MTNLLDAPKQHSLVGDAILIPFKILIKSPLAVSPLSILSNWEKQIEDHCAPGALSACVYYGSNRNLSAQDLQNYDVVITTYQTITGEFGNMDAEAGNKKRKTEQVLFTVNWKVSPSLHTFDSY
jgi:SNF2 family DNA or RNA helicase